MWRNDEQQRVSFTRSILIFVQLDGWWFGRVRKNNTWQDSLPWDFRWRNPDRGDICACWSIVAHLFEYLEIDSDKILGCSSLRQQRLSIITEPVWLRATEDNKWSWQQGGLVTNPKPPLSKPFGLVTSPKTTFDQTCTICTSRTISSHGMLSKIHVENKTCMKSTFQTLFGRLHIFPGLPVQVRCCYAPRSTKTGGKILFLTKN